MREEYGKSDTRTQKGGCGSWRLGPANGATLFELEDAVRKLRVGKAYDLRRQSLRGLARAIWPLFPEVLGVES